MKRISFRGSALGAALAPVLAAALVPAAWAGTAPQITPTSIAGAKLGLGANAYKRLLGKPYHFEAAKGGDISQPGFQNPSDYSRIVFPKRKIDVYFKDGIDRAIQITTWNKAYRTAGGVGAVLNHPTAQGSVRQQTEAESRQRQPDLHRRPKPDFPGPRPGPTEQAGHERVALRREPPRVEPASRPVVFRVVRQRGRRPCLPLTRSASSRSQEVFR